MKDGKKKINLNSEQEAEELDKVLDEFAQLIAEEPEGVSELEPFERYTHKLQAKVHSGQFGPKFAKGYRVLLEELKNSP